MPNLSKNNVIKGRAFQIKTNPIGEKFNSLTVVKEVDRIISKSGLKQRAILCKCDCGNHRVARLHAVVNGYVKSCGCTYDFESHGESRTSLYGVWRTMKDRCVSPFCSTRYKDTGINVCEEWKESYLKFKSWALSNGYKKGLEIDREDNNGNYEPTNCRFVTIKVNVNNRCNTLMLNYKGTVRPFTDILTDKGITSRNAETTIRSRIKRGWPIEEAIDTPIKTTKHIQATIID